MYLPLFKSFPIMKKPLISGIQQMGIGILNVHGAFKWYRQTFGMDVPVFDEAAEAELMLPYTGGEPRSRHAILALNMQGGGGMEIWQYTSRVPQPATFEIQAGDLGLYITKIKARDIMAAYKEIKARQTHMLGGLMDSPVTNRKHFYCKDPYGNIFEVIEPASKDHWFKKTKRQTGGIYGATIGVSNMEASMKFYKDIMGYDTVVYDHEQQWRDFEYMPGGDKTFRRVLLRHSQPRQGAFTNLLGASELELIQVMDRTPKKIFENRLWGDLGFIHLCFDITGMSELRDKCKALGHPFTVDSTAGGDVFDMGEAAGRFSYIEDPDGALIEFVEALKVPIMKKIGWYLDLRKRKPGKPLPNWMIGAMGFGRVKD